MRVNPIQKRRYLAKEALSKSITSRLLSLKPDLPPSYLSFIRTFTRLSQNRPHHRLVIYIPRLWGNVKSRTSFPRPRSAHLLLPWSFLALSGVRSSSSSRFSFTHSSRLCYIPEWYMKCLRAIRILFYSFSFSSFFSSKRSLRKIAVKLSCVVISRLTGMGFWLFGQLGCGLSLFFSFFLKLYWYLRFFLHIALLWKYFIWDCFDMIGQGRLIARFALFALLVLYFWEFDFQCLSKLIQIYIHICLKYFLFNKI